MNKFWDSLPTFRNEKFAKCVADVVKDYLMVNITIKEVNRLKEIILFSFDIPDTVDEDTRFQIEAFIVAYSKGFEDGHIVGLTDEHITN